MASVPKPVADARTMAVPTRWPRGAKTVVKSESQDLYATLRGEHRVLELR